MNTHRPTIFVGIPAFNEERNIGNLLNSLLAQKISSGQLVEILVISDASTDRTVEIVRSYVDPRIKIIQKSENQGVFQVQNDLLKAASTDIAVLVQADILPANEYFIEELIKPIIADDQVGLVCAQSFTTRPRTFVEKILSTSFEFKKDIYTHLNSGSNLYFCVGVARAFSQKLYQQLQWPSGMPEDVYSYFACLKAGLRFVYAPSAKLLFRVPSTLRDHIRQSTRYYAGKEKIAHIFGTQVIDRGYHIPFFVGLAAGFRYFMRTPLLAIAYPVFVITVRFFLRKTYQAQWQTATSTKESITLPGESI